MKIILFFSSLIVLFSCKNNTHREVAGSSNKEDTSSSFQVLKGPSSLSSLQFQNNYPTHETLHKLYDAMDFQRACQVYLETFPLIVQNNGDSLPPTGFSYWKKLSEIVNTRQINKGDMAIITTLKDLGIERENQFNASYKRPILAFA